MCVVSIKVDEARLQKIDPSFADTDIISRWLQSRVDELIDEMSTMHKSPNAHTAEEMRVIMEERIHRLETGEEKLKPNEVVFDKIFKKYGFED